MSRQLDLGRPCFPHFLSQAICCPVTKLQASLSVPQLGKDSLLPLQQVLPSSRRPDANHPRIVISVKTLGLKFHLRWENFLSQTVKHKAPTPLPPIHVEPPDTLRRNHKVSELSLPAHWDPLPQQRGG